MRVVFLSNFFNHHQKPLSDALFDLLGGNYHFVETAYMSSSRKQLGWGGIEYPSYVIRPDYAFSEEIQMLINDADVVITGSAPDQLVRKRIWSGKLTLRYSERPLKKGFELWKYPYRFLKWHFNNPPRKPIYMLCASAYTSSDYAKFGLFRNRCFKWGYFPKTYHYADSDALIASKQPNSIVWVARHIPLKHPEVAIELGRRLKQDGYDFSIVMIGNGPLLSHSAASVIREKLENEVHVIGAVSPEEVRTHMENAQIHIFTSDRNEGWGAVLNEAMNSACVPVVSSAVGAAAFLVEDGKNGFLYDTVDELYEKVKYLLDHSEERIQMANAAYRTITDEWNAENAAAQFISLASQLLEGNKQLTVPAKGVCSKAELLK